MILAVTIGALIMFVGVLGGFAVTSSSQWKAAPVPTNHILVPNNNDVIFNGLLDKMKEREGELMQEEIERALELLRENSKDVPQDVADEIEELLETVNRKLKS